MKIFLQFYDDSFEEQINAYQITEEQLKFTGSPLAVLGKAKSDKDYFPVLILDKQKNIIGFFVLNMHQRTYSDVKNDCAILLRAFSIDNRYTGKGHGKKAMLSVTEFVRDKFPFVNEIVLGVNEINLIARNLYLSIGYKPLNIRFLGRSGWQEILSLSLL